MKALNKRSNEGSRRGEKLCMAGRGSVTCLPQATGRQTEVLRNGKTSKVLKELYLTFLYIYDKHRTVVNRMNS